jgi:hypothetical protein
MSKELKTPRETDGVLFNINPRIDIFTTETIEEKLASRGINQVAGLKMHSYKEQGKGVSIVLRDNRLSLKQLSEVRENYLDISSYDIFDTKLTRVSADKDIEGLFTGFKPLVRGQRVKSDVVLEITSTEATRRGIMTELGPSANVKRARGKHIITNTFPTGISVEEPDKAGYPRRIAEKLNIPFEDISFAARGVTTELSDIIG